MSDDPRSLPSGDVGPLTRQVLQTIDEYRREGASSGLLPQLRRFGTWLWHDIAKLTAAAALLLILAGFLNQGIQLRTLIDSAVADHQAVQGRREIVDRHLRLGDDLLAVGSVDAARAEYEQALTLDPTNTEAQLDLSRAEVFAPIRARDYDPEIARKRIDLLLETNNNDPVARTFLGDIYASQGRTNKALEQYGLATRANPKLAYAFFQRGFLLDRVARPLDALASYKRAAELSPDNQLFANNVAYQLFRTRRYDAAIAKYEALLTVDYRYILPYYMLASAYRIRDDLASASRNQETAVALLDLAEARGLIRNEGKWFFHIAESRTPGEVLLTTWNEKRRYALLSLALTSYLDGRRADARAELRQARKTNVRPPMPHEIRTLLQHDMALLRAERPQLDPLLRGFSKLLIPDAEK